MINNFLQVTLFRCDDRQLGFPFLVDSLMSGISLIVTDNVGSLLSINVTSLTSKHLIQWVIFNCEGGVHCYKQL